MDFRSNLDTEAVKSPVGTSLRKVVKMKMLEIYFACNWQRGWGEGNSFILTLAIPVVFNIVKPLHS